jgi:hypothetical protein
MLRDRGDVRRRFRGALGFAALALALCASSACTAVVAGGVAVALVGVSALTSHCYDYLDVTVFDEHGRKTCAAKVTAHRNQSSESFELQSCYYAPLSDGHWTLRATLPGRHDVETVVEVDHKHDCTRHVQSAELTLEALGAKPENVGAKPTMAGPAPIPAVSAQIPASALPASSASLPANTPPSTSAAPPSATPSSSTAPSAPSTVLPTSGGATSIGVFPNQSDSSR